MKGGTIMKEPIDIESLQSFYKGLSEIIGIDAMLAVYEHYRGSQLTIPTHLYDRKRAAIQVLKKYDGSNSQFLARKYGYSQKWVMKMIHQADNEKKGDK
ncbi:hypothetical protein FD20_GL001973 [Liquorilactobacillus uvarum DSM 19971]|uniref:Mor transcription activator domain-containing protein n=2 Tax=Liquorilactobacillus uvarum TaxID=303240 RepID=A0A0R1Q0W4_9LACO|nr:hypothetical protein FD20_GL001973 [Liquorilactobacillus uvarum DSM 19971]